MKTLIINPPGEPGFDRSGRWPAKVRGGTFVEPLFLAYTAAVLEKEGLPVELIDCRPFYISQEELLRKFNQNIILAVLQTATCSIDQDLETAKKIKAQFPETKIVLVGPHVSVLDKQILKENKYIDFIARGEYEYTIRDLAKSLINNTNQQAVLGITYRKNDEIIHNTSRPSIENLDDLPWPARHFLPMDTYFEALFKSKRTFRLMGSRGCPYQCSFCLWPQTMYGRKLRLRQPKKIVDEIEHLIDVYQARGLYFEDDTFTVDHEHVNQLCDEILRRKIKIPWSCLARVDRLTFEILKKMKQAGCFMIRLGIESSSQEILNRIKKGITLNQAKKAMEMARQIGLETHNSYVLGLPGETKETMEETIKLALELNSDYAQFVVATPYPGTKLYQEAEKNGWLKTKNWANFEPSEKSVLEYPNLKATDIAQASKMAYRRFYFRPKYILRKTLKIRSIKELFQVIKGAFYLWKTILK